MSIIMCIYARAKLGCPPKVSGHLLFPQQQYDKLDQRPWDVQSLDIHVLKKDTSATFQISITMDVSFHEDVPYYEIHQARTHRKVFPLVHSLPPLSYQNAKI